MGRIFHRRCRGQRQQNTCYTYNPCHNPAPCEVSLPARTPSLAPSHSELVSNNTRRLYNEQQKDHPGQGTVPKGSQTYYYAHGQLYDASGKRVGNMALEPNTKLEGKDQLQSTGWVQNDAGKNWNFYHNGKEGYFVDQCGGVTKAEILIGKPPGTKLTFQPHIGDVMVNDPSQCNGVLGIARHSGYTIQYRPESEVQDTKLDPEAVKKLFKDWRGSINLPSGGEMKQFNVDKLSTNASNEYIYLTSQDGKERVRLARGEDANGADTYALERQVHQANQYSDSCGRRMHGNVGWVADPTVIIDAKEQTPAVPQPGAMKPSVPPQPETVTPAVPEPEPARETAPKPGKPPLPSETAEPEKPDGDTIRVAPPGDTPRVAPSEGDAMRVAPSGGTPRVEPAEGETMRVAPSGGTPRVEPETGETIETSPSDRTPRVEPSEGETMRVAPSGGTPRVEPETGETMETAPSGETPKVETSEPESARVAPSGGTPRVEPETGETMETAPSGETPRVEPSEGDTMRVAPSGRTPRVEPAAAETLETAPSGAAPRVEPGTEEKVETAPSGETPKVEPAEAEPARVAPSGGTPRVEPTAAGTLETAPSGAAPRVEPGTGETVETAPSGETPKVEPAEAESAKVAPSGGTPRVEPAAEADVETAPSAAAPRVDGSAGEAVETAPSGAAPRVGAPAEGETIETAPSGTTPRVETAPRGATPRVAPQEGESIRVAPSVKPKTEEKAPAPAPRKERERGGDDGPSVLARKNLDELEQRVESSRQRSQMERAILEGELFRGFTLGANPGSEARTTAVAQSFGRAIVDLNRDFDKVPLTLTQYNTQLDNFVTSAANQLGVTPNSPNYGPRISAIRAAVLQGATQARAVAEAEKEVAEGTIALERARKESEASDAAPLDKQISATLQSARLPGRKGPEKEPEFGASLGSREVAAAEPSRKKRGQLSLPPRLLS